MPDNVVVCWVASTPSTCVWRHPCVVLAAQLVMRNLLHLHYLLRTKLPRLAADSLASGLSTLSDLSGSCPIRRAILHASSAYATGAKRARREAAAAAAAGGAGALAAGAPPGGEPPADVGGMREMPLEVLQVRGRAQRGAPTRAGTEESTLGAPCPTRPRCPPT
jgi:hypothetical protein